MVFDRPPASSSLTMHGLVRLIDPDKTWARSIDSAEWRARLMSLNSALHEEVLRAAEQGNEDQCSRPLRSEIRLLPCYHWYDKLVELVVFGTIYGRGGPPSRDTLNATHSNNLTTSRTQTSITKRMLNVEYFQSLYKYKSLLDSTSKTTNTSIK